MTLFGGKSGVKSGVTAKPGTVRTERIQIAKKPAPLPSVHKAKAQDRLVHARDSPARASPSSGTASPGPPSHSHSNGRLNPPSKRKASRQKSPADRPLESDSSSDDSGNDQPTLDTDSYKRQKTDQPVDRNRRLRSRKAFSELDGGRFELIHAADVLPDDKKGRAAVKEEGKKVSVLLKYPSASQPERFDLVFGKDKIDPAYEIVEIARIVRDVYLTDEQARVFNEPNSGVIRKLVKAQNRMSRNKTDEDLLREFKSAVGTYNFAIQDLLKDGALARNLDNIHHLPLKMIRFILQQVYDRTVSPQVDSLKIYKVGSDEVYGELLPPFVSRILTETGLKSNQVFVDLGSGVGNVVLQAALEFGCESWGCEIMHNACELAAKQADEFAARCRLWGLKTGKVHLERGDFTKNEAIKSALRRADVVLVNNEVFSTETNQALRDNFLDLKDGCHIISLKSFALGNDRNYNDPANLIQNKVHGTFGDNEVSWTSRDGKYFVATKDQEHLNKILAAHKAA